MSTGSNNSSNGASNAGTTIQNTNTDPWQPSQKYLSSGLELSANAYNNGWGADPYQGNVLADASSGLQNAWSDTTNEASRGATNLNEANQSIWNTINNGGWTNESRSAATNLGGFAASDSGLNTGQTQAADDYRRVIDAQGYTEDPRFQAMLDTNANRALNGAATRFGGGRYGSTGIGRGVGNAVAEANNQAMYESNQAARQREMDAISGYGGLYSTGASQKLAANNSLATMAQNASTNTRDAIGQMDNMDALRWTGLDRNMQVQQDQQDRLQTEKDASIQQYEAQQSQVDNEINKYLARINGSGSLGSSSSATSVSKGGKTPWYQTAAGVAGLLGSFLKK